MEITVNIPDDIAQRLEQGEAALSRRLLEFIVADAYRSGKVTTAEVGQLLQLPNRMAVHAFLRQMGTYLNYDEGELEADLETLQELPA
jgi:predicted HTH domain antitoxin